MYAGDKPCMALVVDEMVREGRYPTLKKERAIVEGETWRLAGEGGSAGEVHERGGTGGEAQGGGAQEALGPLRHLPQGKLEIAHESLRVDHQGGWKVLRHVLKEWHDRGYNQLQSWWLIRDVRGPAKEVIDSRVQQGVTDVSC